MCVFVCVREMRDLPSTDSLQHGQSGLGMSQAKARNHEFSSGPITWIAGTQTVGSSCAIFPGRPLATSELDQK